MRSMTYLVVACGVIVRASDLHARQPSDVRDFVRAIHVHGVPYHQAVALGPAAAPTLRAMLSDSAEQRHWSNIATTLGMIGRAGDADTLIAFIQSGATRLPPHLYTAKSSALISLGYIANKSQSPSALAFLLDGLDPSAWTSRVRWESPFHKSAADRDIQLSKLALLGAALSAKPTAAQAIGAIAQRTDSVAVRLAATAQTALREHARVAREGLDGYYRRRPQ